MRSILIATFILSTIPAMAGAVDEEKLGQIVAADMLTKSCQKYRVDPVAAGAYFYLAGIRDGDLSPGGRYQDFIATKVSEIAATRELLLKMGKSESELRKMNCGYAESYYGPNGSLLKGLLLPVDQKK